jgi:hypothetical protein
VVDGPEVLAIAEGGGYFGHQSQHRLPRGEYHRAASAPAAPQGHPVSYYLLLQHVLFSLASRSQDDPHLPRLVEPGKRLLPPLVFLQQIVVDQSV